ncbi:hypothetical protein ABZ990_20355 [Streptomyces sp. NPDC046203]|uniref:hypothetical protein n=1 Tax=Streptomyces sp. NPDC046203 TaxID=3154602 RepID=UPI0033DBAD78
MRYLTIFVIAAPGVVLGAGGIAALRTGWILPWHRRHVRRPALHGWALPAMGVAFAAQAAVLLISFESGRLPQGLPLAASGILVAGVLLLGLAQRGPSRR